MLTMRGREQHSPAYRVEKPPEPAPVKRAKRHKGPPLPGGKVERRRAQILQMIRDAAELGVPAPTQTDMARALGVNQQSQVSERMVELVEDGSLVALGPSWNPRYRVAATGKETTARLVGRSAFK